MNQLHEISVPYRIVGIGPSTRHAPRTERSSYLPQVVDVGKLVARDLLLIGGAPVVGVFEGVEMWVGVEPAHGVRRLERHVGPVAEDFGGGGGKRERNGLRHFTNGLGQFGGRARRTKQDR